MLPGLVGYQARWEARRQAGAGGKGEVCREFTSSVNVQGEMGRHP